METIEVGIRIRRDEGIAFFGLDEVNRRIAEGARVVSVEPGSAVMEKTGEVIDGEEGEGNVTMVLSGCQIRVVLQSEEQT